ncbi:MAG: hypothetical protein O9343_11835 [Burkholderiaceae bacterium]|jgi:hypothetical protein|nr:hypothetical protein [Burkholderiaceae bacterium]MCZ8175875.1 hypothetical protein [Burkholderiaceae bacterium]
MNDSPGRSCPLHYRYRPEDFATPPRADLAGLDTLYVVGGLYGNEFALDALERLLQAQAAHDGRRAVVFNGDFHWFDAERGWFERIQRRVLAHAALRGNVETELADESAEAEAGCGCAYPDWVDDEVVARSNRIHARLRGATTPAQRAELAALPMHARASVGGLQVAVVHGDATSLAGWGFAQEHLRDAAHRAVVGDWFERAGVDAFACSHTCLPVFQRVAVARGEGWVLNNGAAGMPSFEADDAGLMLRLGVAPPRTGERRLGAVLGRPGNPVFADALALRPDGPAWRQRFDAVWPAGSDAALSYGRRIAQGPAYRPAEALRD